MPPPPSSLLLTRLASSTSFDSSMALISASLTTCLSTRSLSPSPISPAMDELESFFLAPQSPRGQAGHRAVHTLRARRELKLEIDAAVAALNDLKIDKASIEKQLQAAISSAVTREAFRQGVINT